MRAILRAFSYQAITDARSPAPPCHSPTQDLLSRRGSGASQSAERANAATPGTANGSRRGSVAMAEDGCAPHHLDVEQLEVAQKQRRSSMQQRRTSLAEVIPDWPQLHKRKAPEKVRRR